MSYVKNLLVTLLLSHILLSCKNDPQPSAQYKTENIVIVVMDGARYSETWGDSSHQYIPNIALLAKQGYVNTNFYNNGVTKTVPGHTAIMTGVYQEIDNSGGGVPDNPSFMQVWLNNDNSRKFKTWVVASKDKLKVLTSTTNVEWLNSTEPEANCGVAGLATGYRHDSITYNTALKIMDNYQPNLILVNFREPDYSAHQANWEAYLAGIRSVDAYINGIWEFINLHEAYKEKTALFITNDHGRHLDSINGGFVSHGDNCEGCRHINLLALGPDLKKGVIDSTYHEQIDITTTIAELLNIQIPDIEGEVIEGMKIGL